MRTRRIYVFIKSNIVGFIALLVALSGTALALQDNTVRSRHIVDGAVKAADLGEDAVPSDTFLPGLNGSSKLATDSVGQTEIALGGVRSEEVANNSLMPGDVRGDEFEDVYQRRITASCHTGISVIERSGMTKCVGDRPPQGGYFADNDTGIICNDYCVEGKLSLPAGAWAIWAKIRLYQNASEDLTVDCTLDAGGDGDKATIYGDTFSPFLATLSMQTMHYAIDSFEAIVRCKDHDDGDVEGSFLRIMATEVRL